jgi:hypothetical protein
MPAWPWQSVMTDYIIAITIVIVIYLQYDGFSCFHARNYVSRLHDCCLWVQLVLAICSTVLASGTNRGRLRISRPNQRFQKLLLQKY